MGWALGANIHVYCIYSENTQAQVKYRVGEIEGTLFYEPKVLLFHNHTCTCTPNNKCPFQGIYYMYKDEVSQCAT